MWLRYVGGVGEHSTWLRNGTDLRYRNVRYAIIRLSHCSKGVELNADGCRLPMLNAAGRLPEGIHRGSAKDLRLRFVDGAPHSTRRDTLLQAFELYAEQVWEILPEARLWVDGGFVTHKAWEPKDIDVVILVSHSDVVGVDQSRLFPLLTRTAENGIRIQPMGGLVDGFIADRNDPAVTRYWSDFWSTVTDESKEPVEGVRKGYVEVIAP